MLTLDFLERNNIFPLRRRLHKYTPERHDEKNYAVNYSGILVSLSNLKFGKDKYTFCSYMLQLYY